MFKTKITEMFGIEYPIIQGGMAYISSAELAASVSNAGGLGIIASYQLNTPDEIREEIRKARGLTDKPFGMNFPFPPAAPQRDHAALIDAALDEGIKIVETAGANPEPFMKYFKDSGAKVLHKTANVKYALTAQKAGADAVAILGQGGAGHPGMFLVSSMVLVPSAVDALDIPVVAAGEVADGRGLVAALALGAQGVLMGTRFMVSQEANIHPNVKQWLVDSKETDTVLLQRSFRNPTRYRMSEIALKVLGLESQNAKLEEITPYTSTASGRKLQQTGDLNLGVLSCGQSVGLVHNAPPIKDIIDSMMEEAQLIIKQLDSLGI